jgi:hypothetical protein
MKFGEVTTASGLATAAAPYHGLHPDNLRHMPTGEKRVAWLPKLDFYGGGKGAITGCVALNAGDTQPKRNEIKRVFLAQGPSGILKRGISLAPSGTAWLSVPIGEASDEPSGGECGRF